MKIVVESEIERTPRAIQLEGLFDIPRERISRVEWDVELPLDEREWSIGLITGPSGSGKSTITRTLWPHVDEHNVWPETAPVIDGFPEAMSIRDVTGLLSSVGFASPPSWLRPYHVLSTGERFRADVALTVARAEYDERDPIVIDEFTSVVDRRVAQIGSAAIAKTVRRMGRRLVAVTVHEDVIDWLQPDWVFTPGAGTFAWRSVQPRPSLSLTVERVPNDLWRLFAPHHYLSRNMTAAARSFVAFHDGQPIAFYSVRRFVHGTVRNAWESVRVVVLPDWQGVGVAGALLNLVAGAARAARTRVFLTAAHPAMIAALAHKSEWKLTAQPRFQPRESGGSGMRAHSARRMTASFEYVGPAVESCLTEHLTIFQKRKLSTI